MTRFEKTAILTILGLGAFAAVGYAASNLVRITETGGQRCIISNGIPDHATGQFPNRGNPHRISAQRIKFCVTRNPSKGSRARPVQTMGIAENGVIIRPGTADWYDPRSPRKHSRNRASGWNLEGLAPGNPLGMDKNNAHVDHRGIYHYHGVPAALIRASEDTRIGWAADGFEVHYVGDDAAPSYRLKSGTRPTAPKGRYDGSFEQDYEYAKGLGNLDECNGATVNGTYRYFATDEYPFYPRCLFGTRITKFR